MVIVKTLKNQMILMLMIYIRHYTDELDLILKKTCNLRVVYNYLFKLDGIVKKSKCTISKLKNKNIVYKVPCNDCSKCYVGQTSRLLETRKGEHLDNIKCNEQYHNVISKHILDFQSLCNSHLMNWEKIKNFTWKKIAKKD